MKHDAAIQLYRFLEEHRSEGGGFSGYIYNHHQTEQLPDMSFCFPFNRIVFCEAMNDCEGGSVECVSFYHASDDTLSYAGHNMGAYDQWYDYANITFRLGDIADVELETKKVLNKGDKILMIQLQNGQLYGVALTDAESGQFWVDLYQYSEE